MFDDYIYNLICNLPSRENPYKLDVVLEGGAFNGSYEIGVLLFLRELEKRNYIRVNRLSGCSVGSIMAYKYVSDTLDTAMEQYVVMRKHFKMHLNLNILRDMLQRDIYALEDKKFDAIKHNVLYINYYNVKKQKEIVKHNFETKKQLICAIYQSCHLPYVIDGKCFSNNQLLDPGIPYIFPERENTSDNKILYVSISQQSRLKNMFLIRNEITAHGRVLEGILDVYNFFLREKPTVICSFVNQWSLLDFMLLRTKQMTITILIYLICILYYINKTLAPILERSNLYHRLQPIIKNMYKDCMLNMCF